MVDPASSGAHRSTASTVGLLRQDTDAQELAPAPGLAQLPQLVATCASAGLDVSVTRAGRPRPLPPGLDLTAYRIVQEALTNVTKHAATSSARVRLDYTPDDLTLTITDEAGTGPAAAADLPDHNRDHSRSRSRNRGRGRGYGLLGMRERALSVGGTFHAGPRPEGGFEVTCTLPLPSSEDSTS